MPDFASRLKELRESRKISQQQLAEKLNVSQVSITHWENQRREPSASVIEKIADFFNVTPAYLMGWDEDTVSKDKSSIKEKLNPGDVILDITKENYELFPEYFDITFMELKKIAFQWGGVDTIDLKTGKRVKNDDFEKMIENLPREDRLKIMQKIINRIIVNPILNTLTFHYADDSDAPK